MTNIELKNAIRNKYTFPGCYEIFGITDDGALLCCDCMKKEYQTIAYSRKHRLSDGWRVTVLSNSSNLESSEFIAENPDDYSLDFCNQCCKVLNP